MSTVTPPEKIFLGGFNILCTTAEQLKEQLHEAILQQQQRSLFFANTNFIVKCQTLCNAVANEQTLIVNDGVGIDIATWLIHKRRFVENLNGTDFIPSFLQACQKDARVYLFGGAPGIARRAAEYLKKHRSVNVVGVCDGFDEASDTEKVIKAMNIANANVVLVAMGNPLQEQWILDHRRQLSASVFVGVGALFNFLAGDKPRAPHWIQHCRLEWLYRLSLEPSRLIRRYTLDIAVFLRLCLKQGKNNVAATGTDQTA